MKPMVIFFAGVPGCGKSLMANFLSEKFSFPILSADAIRYDTKIEKGVNDINEVIEDFEKNRQNRIEAMKQKGKSFVFDASVDRRWPEPKEVAEKDGFQWLLISFDLSDDLIQKFRKMADRVENDELFNKWITDHKLFMNKYGPEAQLHITDENYVDRYKLVEELVKPLLKS